MRNAEVRRTCLALIHNRVCAAEAAADPLPMAMGWQLENGRTPARAMAALCAGAIAGSRATRWQPSADLRALLRAYDEVRQDAGDGVGTAAVDRQRPVDALL